MASSGRIPSRSSSSFIRLAQEMRRRHQYRMPFELARAAQQMSCPPGSTRSSITLSKAIMPQHYVRYHDIDNDIRAIDEATAPRELALQEALCHTPRLLESRHWRQPSKRSDGLHGDGATQPGLWNGEHLIQPAVETLPFTKSPCSSHLNIVQKCSVSNCIPNETGTTAT